MGLHVSSKMVWIEAWDEGSQKPYYYDDANPTTTQTFNNPGGPVQRHPDYKGPADHTNKAPPQPMSQQQPMQQQGQYAQAQPVQYQQQGQQQGQPVYVPQGQMQQGQMQQGQVVSQTQVNVQYG